MTILSHAEPTARKKTYAEQLDLHEIENALDLIAGGAVVEIRVLEGWDDNPRYTRTYSGFFDDYAAAAADLTKLRGAKGVYYTLNPVQPELLARAANRLKTQEKGGATSDTNIVSRRWLPIDADPVRPAGISASDAEHDQALERINPIAGYLKSLGWPDPVVADSGNGGHLLYRIDLPAIDDGLVARVLQALSDRFSDDTVSIDTSVANPARIWKCYGTPACKGDNVPDRPHRVARILETPADLGVVSQEQLEAVAVDKPVVTPATSSSYTMGSEFNVTDFIHRNGFEVTGPQGWQGGGRMWEFVSSPMCDHHDGAAFVGQLPNGKYTAGCRHNSCTWNWHDLRQRVEPREVKERPATKYKDPGLEWLDPSDPPQPAPEWKPFPTHLLPAPFRDLVVESASAVGCDEIMVVLPGLAALASAIGATRVAKIKDSWKPASVLWCVLVAPSGVTKSQGRTFVLAPILARQRRAMKEYEDRMSAFSVLDSEYKRDVKAWEKSKDGGPPPEAPEKPVVAEFVISDATVESLIHTLQNNPRGVLLERDELAAWLGSFDKYNSGSGDAQNWINCFGAGYMKVNRSGLAKPKYVNRAAVSVSGTIQPQILEKMLEGDNTDSGFAARLLMARPPLRAKQWTDTDVSPATEKRFADRVADLLDLEFAVDQEGEIYPQSIPLSSAARARFAAFVNKHGIEGLTRGDSERAAHAKLEEYAVRLALVLQLTEDPDAAEISDHWIEVGIELVGWFGNEAARFYRGAGETPEEKADRKLYAWIVSKGGALTVSEIQTGRKELKTASDTEVAINRLVKAGLGSWRTSSTATNKRREFVAGLRSVDSPETAEIAKSTATDQADEPPVHYGPVNDFADWEDV
ncbi:hypothetical protein Pla108_40840 [Botrimarina colliarenosi]|uniref:DUF3987 domain-containing protein n=1 Tax=Botrimarina colliarenosi TaxID=2528001 RepID=A0A5C5ZZT1_9BACT|nr:DUF3987 domain-containing protein [Botrimarina colliarenosi]TWT92458.1 hypothetical protein Pla108_40840 [Botrimarina colliarenosi]